MAINLYGFKKYGCENIRTCGVNIPAEGSNSSTGTSKTYFDEASSYTIDSKTVYTIPAGSIIKFEFTAGSDVSGSEADNKIEITYVSSLGANTLTSKTYENLLNIGALFGKEHGFLEISPILNFSSLLGSATDCNF